MMMSTLREKTKIVLFVALLAFVGLIFFDWGLQKSSSGNRNMEGPVVGKVNGRDISAELYRRTRTSLVQNFESRTGRAPTAADFDAIEDEVWLTIVRETIVNEQIQKYGIGVSDTEIVSLLKTNPPAEIRAAFTDENGEFNAAAYQQALHDPRYEGFWANAEAVLRTVLPAQKLTDFISSSAVVTQGEIRDRFLSRNEKVVVAYVESSPARVELPEDAVSQEDLRAHYDAHPDRFRSGEQAVLDFVRVPKTPTGDDSSDVRQDLEDLRQEIIAGADFAEVAKVWSDDASADRGGDLGFISHGDMVPEFEGVAFATPAGEVSEVFTTPFGFHLIQVDELKKEDGKEQRHVRHILLRVEASSYTIREAESRMEDLFAALEDGDDLDTAAERLGLTVEQTPAFEKGAAIPGVGLNRTAQRFAFMGVPGTTTSDPIQDESSLYAFRLVERREPGLLPFEEVRDQIDAILRQEKRRELARASLSEAISSTDGTLGAIAGALEAEVDTTIEFTRESFVPGIGRRNAFVAAAFSLTDGERSGLIDSDRGFYVVELVERIEADESALVEQQLQIRQELTYTKRQAMVDSWMEQLVAEAEIVDRRSGEAIPWTPEPSLLVYRAGA